MAEGWACRGIGPVARSSHQDQLLSKRLMVCRDMCLLRAAETGVQAGLTLGHGDSSAAGRPCAPQLPQSRRAQELYKQNIAVGHCPSASPDGGPRVFERLATARGP